MILREIFKCSEVFIRNGLGGTAFHKDDLIIRSNSNICNFNFHNRVSIRIEILTLYNLCKFLAIGDENADDLEFEKGYYSRAFRDFMRKLRDLTDQNPANFNTENESLEVDYMNLMFSHKFIRVSPLPFLT
jgi:hypothetical protein